jgi:hypothetical protein
MTISAEVIYVAIFSWYLGVILAFLVTVASQKVDSTAVYMVALVA